MRHLAVFPTLWYMLDNCGHYTEKGPPGLKIGDYGRPSRVFRSTQRSGATPDLLGKRTLIHRLPVLWLRRGCENKRIVCSCVNYSTRLFGLFVGKPRSRYYFSFQCFQGLNCRFLTLQALSLDGELCRQKRWHLRRVAPLDTFLIDFWGEIWVEFRRQGGYFIYYFATTPFPHQCHYAKVSYAGYYCGGKTKSPRYFLLNFSAFKLI